MADLAKLVVKLEAESAQLRTELQKTNGRLKKWESGVSRTMANVKRSIVRTFSGLGAALAAGGIGLTLRSIVDEANQAQRQLLKLEALVKTTGGTAGLTAKQIDKFSRSLARNTLASTDSVRDAAGILLTFRTISGQTFKDTLKLSQDLVATIGGDLKASVLQLGKALEDPASGLTALKRSGVSFSETEKDLIKTLQKSGKLLEAQGLILEKVRQQVGGAGAAEAKGSLAGAVDTLSHNWSELLENIGNSGPLQLATQFLDGLATRVQTLNRLLFKSDQDKFFELADKAALIREQINSPGLKLPGTVAPLQRELDDIEAQMRRLQDANIAEIKGVGGNTQLEAAQAVSDLQKDILKTLEKQRSTFDDIVKQARDAIAGDTSNPLTKGTVIEAIRALDKAKTLQSGGDTKGQFEAAKDAVELIKGLAESDKITDQYATTLLDQAASLGAAASDRMIELKLDDKALQAEADRARSLIQANFSAEPFTASLEWTNPAAPSFEPLAAGAAQGGAPIHFNLNGRNYAVQATGDDLPALRDALQRENLQRGAK